MHHQAPSLSSGKLTLRGEKSDKQKSALSRTQPREPYHQAQCSTPLLSFSDHLSKELNPQNNSNTQPSSLPNTTTQTRPSLSRNNRMNTNTRTPRSTKHLRIPRASTIKNKNNSRIILFLRLTIWEKIIYASRDSRSLGDKSRDGLNGISVSLVQRMTRSCREVFIPPVCGGAPGQ